MVNYALSNNKSLTEELSLVVRRGMWKGQTQLVTSARYGSLLPQPGQNALPLNEKMYDGCRIGQRLLVYASLGLGMV